MARCSLIGCGVAHRIRVLIVECDARFRELSLAALDAFRFDAVLAEGVEAAQRLLAGVFAPDVILCHPSACDRRGLDELEGHRGRATLVYFADPIQVVPPPHDTVLIASPRSPSALSSLIVSLASSGSSPAAGAP